MAGHGHDAHHARDDGGVPHDVHKQFPADSQREEQNCREGWVDEGVSTAGREAVVKRMTVSERIAGIAENTDVEQP